MAAEERCRKCHDGSTAEESEVPDRLTVNVIRRSGRRILILSGRRALRRKETEEEMTTETHRNCPGVCVSGGGGSERKFRRANPV